MQGRIKGGTVRGGGSHQHDFEYAHETTICLIHF